MNLPRRQFENASCEDIDEAFREIDELCKRWDNRLTVENLFLAKRYLDGELKFGLIIAGESGVGQNFIAIYERKFVVAAGRSGQPLCAGVVLGAGLADINLKRETTVVGCDENQQSVLIDNIQLVETKKGITPSVVRLKPFDDSKSLGANAFDLLYPVAKKVSSVPAYWEASIIRGRLSIVDDKNSRQVIEGRTQIVHTIADDGSPFVGDGLLLSEAVGFCSNMRVFLQEDGMAFSRFESVDGRAQICKVFFGPINLYSDAPQHVS